MAMLTRMAVLVLLSSAVLFGPTLAGADGPGPYPCPIVAEAHGTLHYDFVTLSGDTHLKGQEVVNANWHRCQDMPDYYVPTRNGCGFADAATGGDRLLGGIIVDYEDGSTPIPTQDSSLSVIGNLYDDPFSAEGDGQCILEGGHLIMTAVAHFGDVYGQLTFAAPIA